MTVETKIELLRLIRDYGHERWWQGYRDSNFDIEGVKEAKESANDLLTRITAIVTSEV